MCCEMIITVSLVNIHHHMQLQAFFVGMRTFKINCQQLSNIQFSVIHCSHPVIHCMPRIYLCNWKFVPLTTFTHFTRLCLPWPGPTSPTATSLFSIPVRFFNNVYLFIVRKNTSGGGAEIEGKRENPEQAPHSQHRAQCRA